MIGLTVKNIIDCNFGTKVVFLRYVLKFKENGEEEMKLKIKIKIKSKIYLKDLQNAEQEQPYPLRLAS